MHAIPPNRPHSIQPIRHHSILPATEGEQRNMWKQTQQEALWFHGGNLHLSRFYSLFLALQRKARMEGIPAPVYRLQEVHHLS
jgi:putative flavoprotein involved in K+ transport